MIFYHHCGCFLAHFPSLSFCIHFFSLLVHPYILIFNFSFADPCLALGSSTALSVVVWNWVFSGSQGSAWHSDPRKVNTTTQLILYLLPLTLYYFFWSANVVDVFPIMHHWQMQHSLFSFFLHGQGGIVVRRNKSLKNWECRQEGILHTWGK